MLISKTPEHNELVVEADEVYGDINQLTKTLQDQDERGLILSLSAFAEDTLGSLLKAFMISSEAASQLVEGFNAPLGTFSARIKSTYAFGLISKNQFQDLERLRKIRNEFAHTWKLTSLSQPKIEAHIKAMSYSRIDNVFPETPKDKIRSSITCILLELATNTDKLRKKQHQAKLIADHLITGFSGNDFDIQFENAKMELVYIGQGIINSEGEKHKFYCELFKTYMERLTYLKRPETDEQKKKLADFLDDFKVVFSKSLET